MTYAWDSPTNTQMIEDAMRDFPCFFILATTTITSLVWLMKVMPALVR